MGLNWLNRSAFSPFEGTSSSSPSNSSTSLSEFSSSSTETTDSSISTSSMPSSTSPINIASSARNSSSPSAQGNKVATYGGGRDPDFKTSNAMMGTGLDINMARSNSRQESFAGAKPISMKIPNNRDPSNRPRRESLANSLVGGMSWGGHSVGSWIRDDIIMTGTSPFPYQSPSFHSSSYLPKLEANFMRDFSCCGKTLPSLHDLLQHYEECHAQQTPQSLRNNSLAAQARETPNSKAAIAAQAANSVQQQAQAQRQRQQQLQQQDLSQGNGRQDGSSNSGVSSLGGIQLMRQQQQARAATPVQTSQDDEMEGVEDMEMDDVEPTETPMSQHSARQSQPSMFGQQRPTLNLLNTKAMPGLRTSQPPTPSSNAFGFQNNPTVSSVNTPTLTGPVSQQGRFSPDTSVPGTPAGEMDEDYSNMPLNMNLGNMNMMHGGNTSFPWGYANNDLGVDLCIDEPAKRLYSPNGGGFNSSQRAMQQQFAQFGIGGSNQWNNNDLLQFRKQQMMAMHGMGENAAAMMMGEEHKPFRCPVIGCEKAYKNQNGLKYHKTHGHQTQQLHENGDGTFSIVNPETLTPYPGTQGMEKEKPYKCEVCGKRYKNLNGLKYHKSHSPQCDPGNNRLALGVGVNVAGLPGLPEEGMM